MTDYGHPVTFGLSLYPSFDQLSETRELAQAADAAGLDYLAIQDHAYNPEFLDVWTLIAYLAAETDRISFLPDVADLQLRPPTIPRQGRRIAQRAVRRPGRPRRWRRRERRRHRRHGWHPPERIRDDRVH
jgi:Luciferase-like monooxygenase